MIRTGRILSLLAIPAMALSQPALAQGADTRSADAIPQSGATNPYIREVIRLERKPVVPPVTASPQFFIYLLGPLLGGLALLALSGGSNGGGSGPDSPG